MAATTAPPVRSSTAVADVIAACVAGGLVACSAVLAYVVPSVTGVRDVRVAAPLFAEWLPHVGPGTPVALLVAAAVVWHGPAVAARLSWGRLLLAGYVLSLVWTLGLSLVDGWQRGLAGRLVTPHEYLAEVPGITDVPAALRGFTGRILDFQPDSWATHVAGHPPGALLVFVALDRVGLGGGAWAGLLCVAVGALTVVAVPTALRALGGAAAARVAVPFLVLTPGAVWVGASADGLFAGVTACGLALLAVADHPLRAVVAGLLLGFACYLSYGLVLVAPLAFAVLIAAGRLRALWWVAVGAVAVVAAFTVAGFWWLDGYHAVVVRYHQGIADDRPYAYWVFANLACASLAAGPAMAAVARRLLCQRPPPWALLPLAAIVAMLAADLSGMSKAEVERIWLPFLTWLPAGAVLLPAANRRPWLAAQALTALAINHLLLTTW